MPGRVHRLRGPAVECVCPVNALFPRGLIWMRRLLWGSYPEEGNLNGGIPGMSSAQEHPKLCGRRLDGGGGVSTVPYIPEGSV